MVIVFLESCLSLSGREKNRHAQAVPGARAEENATMPRGKRRFPGGTVFHALNRGNVRQTLFFGPADYGAFVRVAQEALLIAPIRILGYCLMRNHWHFVLWPELDDQLFVFMHQLTNTHVRRWQTTHHREGEGHACQSRFQSFPVESDEHSYNMCRYVERDPVRAGPVERAEDWIWSRVWARLHADDPLALPLCDWPIPHPVNRLDRVNQALTPTDNRKSSRSWELSTDRPRCSPARGATCADLGRWRSDHGVAADDGSVMALYSERERVRLLAPAHAL